MLLKNTDLIKKTNKNNTCAVTLKNEKKIKLNAFDF